MKVKVNVSGLVTCVCWLSRSPIATSHQLSGDDWPDTGTKAQTQSQWARHYGLPGTWQSIPSSKSKRDLPSTRRQTESILNIHTDRGDHLYRRKRVYRGLSAWNRWSASLWTFESLGATMGINRGPGSAFTHYHVLSNVLILFSKLIKAVETPVYEWLPYQGAYLDEIIRLNGRCGQDSCSSCDREPGLYRCKDCFGGHILCHSCLLSKHLQLPLHRILVSSYLSTCFILA